MGEFLRLVILQIKIISVNKFNIKNMTYVNLFNAIKSLNI